MPAASILIKPTSANCNIDCKYCFYKCLSNNREEYSKGFMSEETLEQLIKNAFSYATDLVTFAFQGGEPTLAGLSFFKKAVELQKKYNVNHILVENTIQTNGMLLDQEWVRFFWENDFLVGVSLDGPRKVQNLYRKGMKGEDTFDTVIANINLLKAEKVTFNVVSVVTEDSAKNASNIYRFFRKNRFDYVQFIPCMDESKRQGNSYGSPYAVTAVSYGRFLCELFDLWYQDFVEDVRNRKQPMDIRMFSNLAQMAAGYAAEECGMNGCCNCYFVVEGDGSVYPCDFYCLDQWKLGDVWNPFEEMKTGDKATSFEKNTKTREEKCLDCKYFKLCRGGCRRFRENSEGDLSLHSLCEGYQMFYEHCFDRILRLGEYINNRMK